MAGLILDREPDTSGSLSIFTAGLLDKWGFCDGDLIEIALDPRGIFVSNPREALIKIVEDLVVPKITNVIEVCRQESNHNPIRLFSVDGSEVIDGPDKLQIYLEPEYVDVPVSEILEMVQWSRCKSPPAESATTPARRQGQSG